MPDCFRPVHREGLVGIEAPVYTALGPVVALASSVTWALGTVGYSRLSRTYSGFAVNFARALVALPLLLLAARFEVGSWMGIVDAFHLTQLGWLALSILVSYGLGDILFYRSALILGVSAALAIASTYPFFATLGGVLFFGDEITIRQFMGLIACVAGVVAVILSSGSKTPGVSMTDRKNYRSGVLFAFGAAVLWGINSFSVARGAIGIPSTVANCARLAFALPIVALLARFLAPGKDLVLPRIEFKRWAWLFVAEGFGGSLFYVYGLSRSPMVIGATLTSLAPVIAMPIACLTGAERFSVVRASGVVLVVIGIWLLIGTS